MKSENKWKQCYELYIGHKGTTKAVSITVHMLNKKLLNPLTQMSVWKKVYLFLILVAIVDNSGKYEIF